VATHNDDTDAFLTFLMYKKGSYFFIM